MCDFADRKFFAPLARRTLLIHHGLRPISGWHLCRAQISCTRRPRTRGAPSSWPPSSGMTCVDRRRCKRWGKPIQMGPLAVEDEKSRDFEAKVWGLQRHQEIRDQLNPWE
jgi:hypothetical protein